MPARIPLWIDLRHVPVNKRLPFLRAARAAAAERILVGTDDPHLGRSDVPALRVDGNNALKDGPRAVGRLVVVRAARDQDRAARAEGTVVVDAQDWRVIPLENLIALRRDRPGTLYALARDARQALLFRDTLEHGVDGVVLAPARPEEVEEADRLLRARGPRPDLARSVAAPAPATAPSTPAAPAARTVAPAARATAPPARTPPAARANAPAASPAPARPDAVAARAPAEPRAPPPAQADAAFLQAATVTAVEDAGPGDRVCVDTTSLFSDGEGLLVGSTARAFVLVHAETIASEYVAARPFRVNAGAVHMYVLCPDGRTRYLSELAAGAQVLAVTAAGGRRPLTVGRAKLERRPHTLVRWRGADGVEGHAVLQTAETIRLVRPGGAPVAVTELRPGDEVLVRGEAAARHVGLPVDERLEER